MAKNSKKDYFGLPYILSVILAIIPFTAWLLGALTRFKDGNIIAGIFRLIFGFTIVWILDLFCMIFARKICRLWIFC